MYGIARTLLNARRMAAAAVVVLVAVPFALVGGASGAPGTPETIGIGAALENGQHCADPANTDYGVPDWQEAAVARLSGHYGVLVAGDPALGLFVSDGHWVRWRPTGTSTLFTIAGHAADFTKPYEDFPPEADTGPGPGPARKKVLKPRGMTYHAGRVYLADVWSGELVVRQLTPTPGVVPPEWSVSTIAIDAGTEARHDGLAAGMAVLGGSLLVAQPERNRIGSVSLGGSGGGGGGISSFIGGLDAPRSVAVDGQGVVYVADAKGVYRYAPPYSTGQPVGGFGPGTRQLAVDGAGKTLFVASARAVFQVDLETAPDRSEVLLAQQDAFGITNLWYDGSYLYLGSCRPRRIEPLAAAQPTTTAPPTSNTTAPPTTTNTTLPPQTGGGNPATGPNPDPGLVTAPTASPNPGPAPAGDGGGSQAGAPAPAAQSNLGAQGGSAPANAVVTPPGGGGSQAVAPGGSGASAGSGVGAGSGGGGGSGGGESAAAVPPPVNTPTPQAAGGAAPGSLMPPPPAPSPSPSPHGGLAAVPGNAPLGAPRYAMVRQESPAGPGGWVLAAGVTVLAGCIALCAVGVSASRRRPQRSPARAPAKARATARATTW